MRCSNCDKKINCTWIKNIPLPYVIYRIAFDVVYLCSRQCEQEFVNRSC